MKDNPQVFELAPEPAPAPFDPANRQHGHVVARPDGARARCGGPVVCPWCQNEIDDKMKILGEDLV